MIKLALSLSLLITLPFFQQQEVTRIDNQQLIKLLEDPEVQLVDVRTPREVNLGMIKGAIHINYFDEDFEARIEKLDKRKPIVVYCAAGGRSAKAGNRLTGWGFTKIYDLKEGFGGWKAEDQPIVYPQ